MKEVRFVIVNDKVHGARVDFGPNHETIDIAYIIKNWGGPNDFVESVLNYESTKGDSRIEVKAVYEVHTGIEFDTEVEEVDAQRWSVIFWMLKDKTWTM